MATLNITQRRGLAFYKRSGKPWTNEEIKSIQIYTGDDVFSDVTRYEEGNKWCFDDGTSKDFAYVWDDQERHINFDNCTQVAYEDIFKSEGTLKAKLKQPIRSVRLLKQLTNHLD